MNSMAHRVPAVDTTPTGRALPVLDLDRQIERLVAALPEVIPMAMKKAVPQRYTPEIAAQIADLMIADIRAMHPLRAAGQA